MTTLNSAKVNGASLTPDTDSSLCSCLLIILCSYLMRFLTIIRRMFLVSAVSQTNLNIYGLISLIVLGEECYSRNSSLLNSLHFALHSSCL
jgi:hypothetical protein